MLYVNEDTYPLYARFNHMKNNICSNDKINVVAIEDQVYQAANYWYLDDGFEPILLEELQEVNMGDPQTLSEFIRFSKDQYPAERYLLVMFGHGGAWQGALWDHSHDMDLLTPKEMEIAIKHSNRVDITLMISCEMGAIEPIYQISECTDVFIGSEDAAFYDFFGRSWDEIIALIYSNYEKNTNELGAEIIDAIWDAEGINNDRQRKKATISAIQTDKIKPLVEMIDEICLLYMEDLPLFQESLDWVLPLIEYNMFFQIDLFYFISLLNEYEKDDQIKSKLVEVLNYYDNIILNEKHGENRSLSHGLSIYFPLPHLYPYNLHYSSNELNLKFVADTHWDELLELYFSQTGQKSINKKQEMPLI